VWFKPAGAEADHESVRGIAGVCLLVALALAGCGSAPKARASHTPDAYERAHALTRAPDDIARYAGVWMPEREFLAFAKRWQTRVPYPPDYDGRWEWTSGSHDYEAIHVPTLLIHDASCDWYRYWLARYNAGAAMRRAPETRVLADLAGWPINRRDREYYDYIAENAVVAPNVVREHLREDCAPDEVPKWLERAIEQDRRQDDTTA